MKQFQMAIQKNGRKTQHSSSSALVLIICSLHEKYKECILDFFASANPKPYLT